MKQTLNKLLFVLGLVVLANISPSIASADTFYYGGGYIYINVDGSNPSDTIVSSVCNNGYGGGGCSGSLAIWVSDGYNGQNLTGIDTLYVGSSTSLDLSSIPSGRYYLNFSGSIDDYYSYNNYSLNGAVYFFLDSSAAAASVSVSASPNSIVYGTPNDIYVDWTSSGADHCIEDGGRGGTGMIGSFTDYGVTDVSTYSVFCYDMYGSVVAYGSASVDAYTPIPPPPPAPVLGVMVKADNLNPRTVPYNNNGVDVTWTTTGNPTSCICSYGSSNCGSGFNGPIPVHGTNIPSQLTSNTTFNVSCTDTVASPVPPPITTPTYTPTGYTCSSYYPSCFIADTVVIMSDGTTKNIQDVKIGDVLKGEKTNNKVLGFHDPKLNSKKLYSFNGGRYFVTAEHPFKTIDGWKSINPALTAEENIGIIVTELKVGDTLITENGKVLLKTINSKNDKADTQLYNFILDGDHTYYADGYLVHNKYACMAGEVPNINGECGPACYHTCPSGYTQSCTGGATLCTLESCASAGTSGACVDVSGNVVKYSNGVCPSGTVYVQHALQ